MESLRELSALKNLSIRIQQDVSYTVLPYHYHSVSSLLRFWINAKKLTCCLTVCVQAHVSFLSTGISVALHYCMTHEVPAIDRTNVVGCYFISRKNKALPCLVKQKNVFVFFFSRGMSLYQNTSKKKKDYEAQTKWGKNPWKKQKRKEREWA